jgi:hypothetical protein
MPASNHSDNAADEAADEAEEETAEESAPLSPLEAIRRAQANRTAPPGTGGHGSGRGGGKGANPKAPRMYNRHK